MNKLSKSLEYIADSAETGYSALFTFAVKEILSTEERRTLSSVLRNLANDSELLDRLIRIQSGLILEGQERVVQLSTSSNPTIEELQH